MNSRTGIVMEIKYRKACIMTPDGEFTEVKIGNTIPSIGSTYTGVIEKKLPFYKYVAAAACLVLFTSIGSGAYAYYTPTTSVVVSINPALELKLNRWNKIIKTIALNEDGNKLANSIDIENKDIDTGLSMILEEAEREHFINENDAKEQKISLNITSSKDISLALPKFEEKASSKKLNVKIDYSKGNAKDGIIKNGKKLEKDIEDTTNKENEGKKTDSDSKSLPEVNPDKKDKTKPDNSSKNNTDNKINNSNKNKETDNNNSGNTKEKETMSNNANSNKSSESPKDKSEKDDKSNNSNSNKYKDAKGNKDK